MRQRAYTRQLCALHVLDWLTWRLVTALTCFFLAAFTILCGLQLDNKVHLPLPMVLVPFYCAVGLSALSMLTSLLAHLWPVKSSLSACFDVSNRVFNMGMFLREVRSSAVPVPLEMLPAIVCALRPRRSFQRSCPNCTVAL